jgi:hypothetical protein
MKRTARGCPDFIYLFEVAIEYWHTWYLTSRLIMIVERNVLMVLQIEQRNFRYKSDLRFQGREPTRRGFSSSH